MRGQLGFESAGFQVSVGLVGEIAKAEGRSPEVLDAAADRFGRRVDRGHCFGRRSTAGIPTTTSGRITGDSRCTARSSTSLVNSLAVPANCPAVDFFLPTHPIDLRHTAPSVHPTAVR